MTRTFYLYVDGYDLHEIASDLRTRIESFVAQHRGRVRVVDQREDADEASPDLPPWDLGVNFDFGALADGEKKDLLLFFQKLSDEFGRDFVVGRTSVYGFPEDFVFLLPGDTIEPAFALLTADAKKG